MKFGYLFGNKGRRKNRSMGFTDKFQRDLHAAADKANGFRVRVFQYGKKTTKKGGKLVT